MRAALCIAAVALTALAAVAEPQVNAYVQRQTVAVRSPFLFFIEASGSNVGDPQIPNVDGLNINKQATNTSSGTQISIVGSRSTTISTRRLGYYAQPTRVGKITIPPIAVPIDGQTVYTKPITINVVDRAGGQQPVPEPQQGVPVGATPPATSAQRGDPTWDDAVFVESDVSRRTVYQGEAVLLSLRIWKLDSPGLQVGTYRGQRFEFPTTEGFYAITLDQRQDRKERNGWSYDVTEFRQILYPTVSGDLTVGSWHWEGVGENAIGWRVQRQNFSFDTPPITVTVKPLPERPPDFSGAVGSFTIKAELPRTQLVQGVPAQFIVSVSGKGNSDALNAIPLPKIENVQISDPENSVKPVETGGLISFEKTFSYAITPLAAGSLQIPEIGFCYFDPEAESYKTERTAPITVPVVLSAEDTGPRVIVAPDGLSQAGAVNIIGEDIVSIIENPGRLRPSRASGATAAALVGAPALAYCGLALFMRRRRRFEDDTGFARDYSAKSKGRKRLRNIAQAAEPSEELYKAVAGYIADKFNVPEGGMTSGDVKQLFEERGIDGDLVEGFTRILKACERVRYAGVRLSDEEVGALTEAAVVAMDRLDDQMKRRRLK